MLRQDTIQVVKATASAVAIHAESITRRFYDLMFLENPEVLAYFNPAHQRSGAQQRALAGAICAYAANIENLSALGPAIEVIAHKHCSLGIQPEHYPIVGKHLLVAIREVLGEAATDQVIGAWHEAYLFLAEVFIGREAQIYADQASRPGGWNGYRQFTVADKRPESEIVTSFYLRPVDGGPLAEFVPGQYITVKIDHPISPTPPRNYSLSDRPGLPYYRISVKRESGSTPRTAGLVSNYLHDHVHTGDHLEVGPACGEFTLDPAHITARSIVFLAGGIGITPLLSMLKSLVHHQVSTPIYFIQAARNSRVHALADEVRGMAAEYPDLHIHFCYDEPLEGDLRERRCDSTGTINAERLRELIPNNYGEFYVCGPQPFMSGLYRELGDWGVDPARIHLEFFGPRQDL